MIGTPDFHEGLIFEDEGQIYEILKYQHHRMSQARAVMRCKLRNLTTGSVVEKSYRPEDKFKSVDVEKRPKTYLYADGGTAHFMDQSSYEQIEFPVSKLGDSAKFLSENMEVQALYLNGKLFAIELSIGVVLKVVSTVPGIKGDSVSNLMKPATLESGVEIQVPLFVKEGDSVRVDTRTGEYVERVS